MRPLVAGNTAFAVDLYREVAKRPGNPFLPFLSPYWGGPPCSPGSGLTRGAGLLLSQVVHESFVAVDEEGTEAAAATAVISVTAQPDPPEPPVFEADHPFLSLIRHRTTASIVFMGRVMDPSRS